MKFYPKTQNDREQWILGKFGEIEHDDWLPLISAWKNDDGSITLIPNCKLRPGAKYRIRQKSENAPEQAPDYQCSIRRDRSSIEDGFVELLAQGKE